MTSLHTKQNYLILDNNREYVITIKTINTIRVIIKLMFILLEKIYLERFYQDFKNKVLVDLSDTEYVNNKLFYVYIQYFKR